MEITKKYILGQAIVRTPDITDYETGEAGRNDQLAVV